MFIEELLSGFDLRTYVYGKLYAHKVLKCGRLPIQRMLVSIAILYENVGNNNKGNKSPRVSSIKGNSPWRGH